jgi:hypothetical protein
MALSREQLFGVYFSGGTFLPQKTDLAPPIETQRVPVQRRVLSYSVKIRRKSFV